MSLESWKREFYSVHARDVPVEKSLEHTLRMFKGLRPHNIARHLCLVTIAGDVKGKQSSGGSGGSGNGSKISVYNPEHVALCHHFYLKENNTEVCPNCPVALSRGMTPCTRVAFQEPDPPMDYFMPGGKNPEPMIASLEIAEKYLDYAIERQRMIRLEQEQLEQRRKQEEQQQRKVMMHERACIPPKPGKRPRGRPRKVRFEPVTADGWAELYHEHEHEYGE